MQRLAKRRGLIRDINNCGLCTHENYSLYLSSLCLLRHLAHLRHSSFSPTTPSSFSSSSYFFSLPTSLLLSSYPRPQRFFSQAPPFHRGGYIYEALILGPSKKAQLWSAAAKVWLLRNFLFFFFFFSFFYWLPMSLTMQYFIMESDRNWWNGFLMLVSRSGVFSFFFSKFGVKKV